MILINSGAYISGSLMNEFGKLPPCFLPLGNKKLLRYQVEYIRRYFDDRIVVSLPNQYKLSPIEESLIQELKIETVFVPENISLGSSVLYILNTVEFSDSYILRLLHGDTLIMKYPENWQCLGISNTLYDYKWERENNAENNIWCGYFSLSQPKLLIANLAKTQGDFIQAIHNYKEESSLDLVDISDWYDFGHLNTYFRSRAIITTQRAFNELNIEKGIVRKTSKQERKIQAESNWFNSIPAELKIYIPQLIEFFNQENNTYYKLEYLNSLPLNELFVHSRKGKLFWKHLLNLIAEFMRLSRNIELNDNLNEKIILDSKKLYRDKTINRLNTYAQQTNLDLNKPQKYAAKKLPSLMEIAEDCISRTENLDFYNGVLHGDLCFSNILYDSKADAIKVLDPRGLNVDNELSIYGDQKYDLAKLCHSFVGLYDFIIADSFEVIENDAVGMQVKFDCDNSILELGKLFLETEIFPNFDNKEIIALTVLLFLSMIPLHSDKPLRQKAMLANALRLYTMII